MLDTLITELVEHIIRFLDDKHDLFSVRLVCRQLHQKSLGTFATTWFHTVESDLSPLSLRRLENIARHEQLRVFVQKLRIGNCGKAPQERPLGQGGHWARTNSGCLDSSSPIAVALRDWLVTRLIHCREFEVTDSCGQFPEKDGTDTSLSPTDAAQLLLAIWAGGCLPLRSFRIHLIRCGIMNPSQMSLETLNPGPFRESLASHLQDLELSWGLTQDVCFEAAFDLVSTAKHLKTLHLNWHISKAAQQFLSRLSEAPIVPALTNLKLGALNVISQTTLSNMLFRFQGSLTSLHFSHVHLASGTWSAVFKHLRQDGFSHLECITASSCFEDPKRGRVLFCPLRGRSNMAQKCDGTLEFMAVGYLGKNRVQGVRYRGTGIGMQLALEALEESNYILYRNGPPSPGCPDEKPGREGLGNMVMNFI